MDHGHTLTGPPTRRRRPAWRQWFAALAAAACWAPAPATAFELAGDKALVAVTRDQTRTRIGTVRFSPLPGGGGSRFEVRIDPQVLQDHFLSMREFKCLPGTPEITCFVPYPYRQPGTVSPTDLAWLEHSLLFFYKQPADFGAKLWNGLLFRLTVTPTALVGTPHAVDLNRIGVPPDPLDVPPFGPHDADPVPPGARWLQELRIE
ncbi:hypothetical protein [Hydrogenophaga sp.]|uniref:hypothetical protein n=1 Tax=Hydrogenophaga sp. TaxID=1904254 RepID=UPI0035AE5E54